VLQHRADLLDRLAGVVEVGPVEVEHELLAPDATGEVLRPERRATGGGEHLQREVAGRVPVHVVDPLEVVEVGHHDDAVHRASPVRVPPLGQLLHQLVAVEQAGQTVAGRAGAQVDRVVGVAECRHAERHGRQHDGGDEGGDLAAEEHVEQAAVLADGEEGDEARQVEGRDAGAHERERAQDRSVHAGAWPRGGQPSPGAVQLRRRERQDQPRARHQPRIWRRAPFMLVGTGPRGMGAAGRIASSAFSSSSMARPA
jgi:hypothetical protein